MPPPLIAVDQVSESSPGVKALDRMQFELLPAEVHALVGDNSAGKSS